MRMRMGMGMVLVMVMGIVYLIEVGPFVKHCSLGPSIAWQVNGNNPSNDSLYIAV